MGCSSGPDIIQDGLVLCLDAASKRSYGEWYYVDGFKKWIITQHL